MRQLMHLDLRENQLTSLPESIRELHSLEKLDARWNGLLEMPWLKELRERGCVVYT
jgi:Leucine-rich repeat (LRR) protein